MGKRSEQLCPICRLPYLRMEPGAGKLNYIHGPVIIDGNVIYSTCQLGPDTPSDRAMIARTLRFGLSGAGPMT